MSIFTAIVTYIIVWWTVIFMVLPIGAKSPYEAGEETDVTQWASAPKNANIKLKMLWTSGISLVILGVIYALIEMNVIDFRQLGNEMAEKHGL